MKATEQYFPEVLFIMLYKVALTFESVDAILTGADLEEMVTDFRNNERRRRKVLERSGESEACSPGKYISFFESFIKI